MISKGSDAGRNSHQVPRDIDEADKVAAQLNEFHHYSRPREVRRTVLPWAPWSTKLSATLTTISKKSISASQVQGEQLSIQADDNFFRQALFNLLLNAIQAG